MALFNKNTIDSESSSQNLEYLYNNMSSKILRWLYRITKRVPFASKEIRSKKRLFKNLCPYTDERAEELAAQIFFLGAFIALLAGVGSFVLAFLTTGLSPYSVTLPFVVMKFVYDEVFFSKYQSISRKINLELSTLFQNVSHIYQSTKGIILALESAADSLSDDMKIITRSVIDMLNSDNPKEIIQDYLTDQYKNPYMKLLINQCYEAHSIGAMTEESDRLIFCENMEMFRMDMVRENISNGVNIAKLRGLALMIWLPVIGMGIVQRFTLKLSDDVAGFYASYGTYIELVSELYALWITGILNKTRFKFLQSLQVGKTYYKIQQMFGLFEKAPELPIVQKLHKVSCNVPTSVLYTKLVCDALLGLTAGLLVVVINAVWHNILIKPLQLLFGLVGLGYPLLFIVSIQTLYNQFKANKRNEVNAFQLTMLSEMYSKTITLYEMLERIESIASFYKYDIGQCLNNFGYDREYSLLVLKSAAIEAKDNDFANIVDMCLSVDRVGITKALGELKINRELSVEERMQMNEIGDSEKRNFLELFAVIPMILTIGIYMILPFAMSTIKMFQEVFSSGNINIF